jgi:hypothetical protein
MPGAHCHTWQSTLLQICLGTILRSMKGPIHKARPNMFVQLKLESYSSNGNQAPSRCRRDADAHRNAWQGTLLTINMGRRPHTMGDPIHRPETLLKLLKAPSFCTRHNPPVLLKPCLALAAALASQQHRTSLVLTTALTTLQTLVAGVSAYSNYHEKSR